MNTETNRTAQTPDDVLSELRSLMAEAERILGQAPHDTGNCEATMAALRERLEATQARVAELYEKGKKKVAAGAKYADETIRDNPYQSIAVALGVGLLAGVLLGRRWNSSSQ